MSCFSRRSRWPTFRTHRRTECTNEWQAGAASPCILLRTCFSDYTSIFSTALPLVTREILTEILKALSVIISKYMIPTYCYQHYFTSHSLILYGLLVSYSVRCQLVSNFSLTSSDPVYRSLHCAKWLILYLSILSISPHLWSHSLSSTDAIQCAIQFFSQKY